MRATSRFALRELPWTVRDLLRFALVNAIAYPFLFCYAWFALLYLSAWIDYWNGLSARRPAPLHQFKFVWWGGLDPGFGYEADTLFKKWQQGMVFYLICLVVWNLGARWVWRKSVALGRRVLWRYE